MPALKRTHIILSAATPLRRQRGLGPYRFHLRQSVELEHRDEGGAVLNATRFPGNMLQ